MSFLPNDYQLPTTGSGNYTKLKQGANKLRILSNPITGYLRWEDKKPLRTRQKMTGEDKHFWAMKVWNYDNKQIEVWEVTQATIQESIMNLWRGSWGDPKEYDLEVTRSGQDLETKYMVMPQQKAPISSEVQDSDVETQVNLEALFDGGDVFETNNLPFS